MNKMAGYPGSLKRFSLCAIPPQIVNGVPQRKQNSHRLRSQDRDRPRLPIGKGRAAFSLKTNGLTESPTMEIPKKCSASPRAVLRSKLVQ